ncbi:MAG: cytochrome c oxidase subunit II [Bacteroidetes bacterium]|nr:cytochrome c oxidase subunit II [Bacteroidota bacterium]
MNTGASNFVEGVDWVFKLLFGISAFFLIVITAMMIFFVIRYNRKRHPKAVQIKDNMALEITWITIPVIIVLFLFYYGFSAFQPMIWVPKDAMKVKVIGKMWQWSFEYPGNKVADTLVLPLNRPVKLDLVSVDVIHGFSIPAFRVKEDVVPGKNNYMWFTPQQTGNFEIFCTAYCGVRHSYMGTKVRVVTPRQYDQWLASVKVASEEPGGLQVLKKNACTGCHSLDGSKLVSASFKGLYGKTETVVTNGTERKVKVDDEYITTSIYEPDKDLVSGYSKGIMKSYKGIVKEDEAKMIIEYLKTLK